ncbi:HAMP domain-containing protein, partial [Dysosmobacter sp.]|uniref:HAMP domain-containing protein n=1 Tax=Dysosmobacter sp. TaxID=2591382 RepID=UPI003AB40078
MKRLSLQWRITLMSVLLIGITCVAMNLLLCSSGVYYMDTIADSLQGGGVEQVQLNNLADMRIDEDAISEFRQLSRSFNQMLERLNNA